MKTAAPLVLINIILLFFEGTCQVNNFVQVTCSPEWPLKPSIILSEVMPFRKISARVSTVHTQKFFLEDDKIYT